MPKDTKRRKHKILPWGEVRCFRRSVKVTVVGQVWLKCCRTALFKEKFILWCFKLFRIYCSGWNYFKHFNFSSSNIFLLPISNYWPFLIGPIYNPLSIVHVKEFKDCSQSFITFDVQGTEMQLTKHFRLRLKKMSNSDLLPLCLILSASK